MKKNKFGFIRIIEAFAMIMIITGVLLVFLNQKDVGVYDISISIHEMEQEILTEVQSNASLREEILSQDTLPVEWENFPNNTKSKIQSLIPSDFNCQAKICDVDDGCVITEVNDKEIFAQRILISADLSEYDLKQLKLFCWEI